MEIPQEQINLIRSDLEQLEQWIKPVTDEASCKLAADNLKGVKIKIKEIEDKRTELVKPLNDTVKRINAIFKPFLDRAEALKGILSKNVLDYQREVIRQREEAERQRREEEKTRLEEEALKSDSAEKLDQAIEQIDKIDNTPSEVPKGIKSDWSNTKIRENWTYEIIDSAFVPSKYCSPDHKLIMEAIRRGEREIKGLKIYDKGSIASL